MVHYDCLIVGGGHAGAQAAISLRQSGFEGSLGILSAESDLPYERPPLSKDYLVGARTLSDIHLRPPQFWTERKIDVLLGKAVEKLDSTARRVECADRSTFEFGCAIWAAGGRPRQLSCSGHQSRNVHTLRSRSEVDDIRKSLGEAQSVAVVGGGYIGLEAAAALRTLGKSVVVLEAASRLLARVCGEAVSQFYLAEHGRRGVEVRLNALVEHIEVDSDRIKGVVLGDGSFVTADMLLVGIGIEPLVAPLLAAGAKGGNGVTVDEYCRTTLPGVYAIGDCALHPNPYAGGRLIRLESVQNANDQAIAVAKSIAGSPTVYRSMPWFWSKQYDLMMQTVGFAGDYDQVVVRGEEARRSFAAVYLKEGRVNALDCINAPADFVQGRHLIQRGLRVDISRLADPNVKLKSLLS